MSGVLSVLLAFVGGDIGAVLLRWALPAAAKPLARKVAPWVRSVFSDEKKPEGGE